MRLLDQLARLDARVLKSVRQPGEPAERYLRRVAARRFGFGQRDALAVHRALQQHLAALDAERAGRA